MKNGREFMQTIEYKEKMRELSLNRGYGKWMVGKKHTTETTIIKMGKLH